MVGLEVMPRMSPRAIMAASSPFSSSLRWMLSSQRDWPREVNFSIMEDIEDLAVVVFFATDEKGCVTLRSVLCDEGSPCGARRCFGAANAPQHDTTRSRWQLGYQEIDSPFSIFLILPTRRASRS